MPGSLGGFTRPPFFFSSLAFLRWCSLIFFSTLYFWCSVTRLLRDLVDFFGIAAAALRRREVRGSASPHGARACTPQPRRRRR